MSNNYSNYDDGQNIIDYFDALEKRTLNILSWDKCGKNDFFLTIS